MAGCELSVILFSDVIKAFSLCYLRSRSDPPLSPSLALDLGQIQGLLVFCVCPLDFPCVPALLDLLGRGDYVLEHLKPAGLPRASCS